MSKRNKDTAEKKRIQALKALFKKVVRIVSLNNPWIDHDNSDEEQQYSTNVKKNISMVIRSRYKTGILTAAEKTIIRTPHKSRTIPERRKLCSLFAALRCLARFTPKMRARLVPVMRLLPINAGRNIMRESDVPITVFFILVGEVQMIKGEDSEGNELVEAIFGPGDLIGDVELLEGCNRTHTFKASTYCELLVLFDYDFAEILGPYMTKIWDEKKRALKALDYFDFLDDDQIVEACRFGSLKQYNPLETIYCDDVGSLTNVHFVLSGECLILQCLNMAITRKNGKRVYQLLPADEDDTSKMFRQGVRSTLSDNSKEEPNLKLDINALVVSSSSSSSDKDPRNSLKHLMRKMNLRDIETACGLVKEMKPPLSRLAWRKANRKSSIFKFSDDDHQCFEEDFYEDFWEAYGDNENDDISSSDNSYDFDMGIKAPFKEVSVDQFDRRESDESEFFVGSSSSSASSSSDDGFMPVYDSRFIDVGSLTFGGIFGLGEKMEHRVVMARTTVQCLTLPRFFLLEKKQNPGNIWERRLFYLECMIPSREALFEHFLKTREWKKFKNDFIHQSLKHLNNNVAHIDDVPIICRIVESPDDVN